MKKVKIEPFKVIGIEVKTTNENNQAANDIPELWKKMMSENVISKIPDKVDDTVYSIYTEYEKDHTRPYTTILGCKVNNLDEIPNGMVGKSFEGGSYLKFMAKGDLSKDLVINEWIKIWNMDLERIFTADFEIYEANKVADSSNAEVDILIAIK